MAKTQADYDAARKTTLIRIDLDLLARISMQAAKNHTTVKAEIDSCLRKQFCRGRRK